MENKHMPFIVASCASLACLLFLPFIDVGIATVSLWDAITEGGLDQFLSGEGIGPMGIYVALAGGIVAIVGGFMNKIAPAKWGSVAGVAGCVVFLVALYTEASNAGADFGEVLEVIGIGFWLAVVGFAVSIKLADGIQE